MMKMMMSAAAAAILRALIVRSGADRDRILLTDVTSTDWQSLTFTGERHLLRLRIAGPTCGEIADRMCEGLAEAQFTVPGAIVADIGVVGERTHGDDGAVELVVEALTVADD